LTIQPAPDVSCDSDTERHHAPLPITIAPGMSVVDITSDPAGTLVAFTGAYCIYRLDGSESLAVASWRDIAVGPVCPAAPLLSASVTENDRHNASATVLRELLALKQFGLTECQATSHDELIRYLGAGVAES